MKSNPSKFILIATVMSAIAASAAAVSESFIAFTRPETSSFWRTAPGQTLTVPVDFPEGADAATLTVTGSGYVHEYSEIDTDTFEFTLPAATDADSENVYTLTLAFNDAATTVRTAKLALVYGLDEVGEGSTRCILPESSREWSRVVSGHAVLPVPFGTTSFTVNGSERVSDLDGAAGWYRLDGIGAEPVVLTLTAGGQTYSASLVGRSGLTIFLK